MLLTKNKTLHLIAGAVVTFNLLTLKLFLKKPDRVQTYPGRVFRDYMSLVGEDRWSSKDIFEIFPQDQGVRITIEHLPGKGVGTPIDELAYLAFITKTIQPRKVFEIGTFRGRTALNFALNSPDDCKVYTLDLPAQEKVVPQEGVYRTDTEIIQRAAPGEDFMGKDISHKIIQLFGNSLTFDFSPYYGEIDLVFVDGAHNYQAVKSDSENALKMVKPNGLILWHDFANFGDYNDVTLAIRDCVPLDQVVEIANTQLALYHKDNARL